MSWYIHPIHIIQKAKIEETKDEKDEDQPEEMQYTSQRQKKAHPKINIDKLQRVKSLVRELTEELQGISDQIYACQPLRPIDNGDDSQNYAADDEHTPPFQYAVFCVIIYLSLLRVDEDYETPYKVPTDDPVPEYITTLGSYSMLTQIHIDQMREAHI